MEQLILFQEQALRNISEVTPRYLLNEIDWSNRLIAIKGARGTGKTTLLLYYLKTELQNDESLYASLDNLYFLENTLVSLATQFVLNGGTHLLLDEVHKYPRWSRELKLLYDQFPKLKIIVTSSSMLELYKGESDLSRRLVTYNLHELSFREYVEMKYKYPMPQVTLKELLNNHKEISRTVVNNVGSPIKYFQEYLKIGAYPYVLEGENSYHDKLLQTLQLILEVDLNVVENVTYTDALKIKKLLIAIAESAPFTPNISKISERLGLNRKFLLNAISLLNKAGLLISLHKPQKGIGAFTKPEKIYLHNTNLIYALHKNQSNTGAIRETFFANQLLKSHKLHLAEKGDFLIDEQYTFEIGGKSKNQKQLQGVNNAFIVKDSIEIGGLNIIPLYLFGLLY